MAPHAPALASATDAALVAAARAGQGQAFAELYRRHAEAAWRVALSITHNPADAADAVSESFAKVLASIQRDAPGPGAAFRPYLLAATRNAAIDICRRAGRLRPTPTGELPPVPAPEEPADSVVVAEDATLVAQAFAELPERWRSVLWLTEIEGQRPSEVAVRLGLTPNGAAQLAVRARAGLRERYLQAHVRTQPTGACRFTLEHLGAYVNGSISLRDLAKVDQHLAECGACRARRAELEDVRTTLRRALLPLPLGLAATSFRRWRDALVAAHRSPAALAAGTRTTYRLLAGASAALFAAGVIGLNVKSRAGGRESAAPHRPVQVEGFTLSRPPAPASAQALPPPPPFEAPLPDMVPVAPPVAAAPDGSPALPATPPAPAPGSPNSPPTSGTSPTRPASPNSGAPSSTQPVAQITASASDGSAAVTVGVGIGEGGCTGVAAGSLSLGCAPPPSPDPGVEVTLGGSALPPARLHLP